MTERRRQVLLPLDVYEKLEEALAPDERFCAKQIDCLLLWTYEGKMLIVMPEGSPDLDAGSALAHS